MTSRSVLGQLVASPFVGSWVGRARPGDRYDPDAAGRASAWAHWAMGRFSTHVGAGDRSYFALELEGSFHDPKGLLVGKTPHLEIPGWMWDRADTSFPDRLSQAGNALGFPWWLVPEVTAARRALFNTKRGSIAGVVEVLNARRGPLVDSVRALVAACEPGWATVEQLLVGSGADLSDDVAGDFTAGEVASFFPGGKHLGLEVRFDDRLRSSAGLWVARRVGVWQVCGVDERGGEFSFGVLTPRLTANSQFHDRSFAPDSESPAALLVRGLLLERLARRHLPGVAGSSVAEPGPTRPVAHLRTVVARHGGRMPEASLRAAVGFLQAYPDPDVAWQALSVWAERTRTLLAVGYEPFRAAHLRAATFLRRAEEPDRADVNVLLPIGWDDRSRAVRVTFSRADD